MDVGRVIRRGIGRVIRSWRSRREPPAGEPAAHDEPAANDPPGEGPPPQDPPLEDPPPGDPPPQDPLLAPVALVPAEEVYFPSEGDTYLVRTPEIAARVFRDTGTFSSEAWERDLGRTLPGSLVGMDPPRHTACKKQVTPPFKPGPIAALTTELIRPTADRYIRELGEADRPDLNHHLATPFPVEVLARYIGLPFDDLDELIEVSWGSAMAIAQGDRSSHYHDLVKERCTQAIESARSDPGDDVASHLLQEEDLTDEARVDVLRLILAAGIVTTQHGVLAVFLALLTHPDRWRALSADRSLIPTMIDEALRETPPLRFVHRCTTEAVELGGLDIARDSLVSISIYDVHRDPGGDGGVVASSEDRQAPTSMVFGRGHHTCLGMHLALAELQELVSAALDHFDDMRLDPAVDPEGLGHMEPSLSIPLLLRRRQGEAVSAPS